MSRAFCLFALILSSAPVHALTLCEVGLLVALPDLDQAGMIEGEAAGHCLVRLDSGHQISRLPATLLPGTAGDTPPDVAPYAGFIGPPPPPGYSIGG